ncbi:EF hand domain containing protein [Acanthamoeba castellanii str. Neff]|uniref:EF hand domain containing protein n=1 Tax=Acanthamoeba castellanii (strain ATCC 30010 / Neff) TaxID=1257118 RepID=L8H8N3_ACACF|nr:EF hand domain containing protein [Acanthamoeba castellanii str. Neff]ELR21530.1 EF hand domain containing protein [Acanthamoeba castellanii str. Neff]
MQRATLPVPPARNHGGKLSVGLTLRFPDMTKEEIETVVAAFQKFDLDGNGRLDKQEFALVMEEVKKTNKGKGAADRMLMDLHFDAMDKDHSGGIDIEEFIAGYNSLFHEERHELALKLHAQHPEMEVHQIERVLKAFEKFDKDGDGVLDAEEFYQLKEELMPEVSKVLLRLHTEKRFSHADDDGSGDLNRVELVAAYREIFGSQSGLSPRVGNIPINAQSAFEDFATCDTLLATRQRFNELKETCEAAEGGDVYEAVRGRMFGHPRWKPFFQLIDKLRKQV